MINIEIYVYNREEGSSVLQKYPAIFSFFSGAGFLDLGFELSEYEVVYVNELHPPFIQSYKYSREQLGISAPKYGYHEGDIKELIEGNGKQQLSKLIKDCRKLSKIIGFIGGPPCPDFSVGGKNRGRHGDNGKLSATYIELICQQKPDFFLFENVKGLLRTKIHRDFFEELKGKIHKTGYVTTEKLINTIEYGVPQDRERIILIGFKKELIKRIGVNADETKTIPDNLFPWEQHIVHPMEKVLAYPWVAQTSFKENSIMDCPEGIPEELTVEYWFRKNDVYNHPNAGQYFNPKAGIVTFEVIPEGDVSKKSYKRLHRWRYSPTACYGNNEVHLHPYKIRRISVAEALAIQSLPKEFVLPQSLTLTNAFKTVGNGVPFLAAKAVAETILDFLGVVK